jgi:hypothetical protein
VANVTKPDGGSLGAAKREESPMMNLPATFAEEEAIAAVAGWTDVVREKMSAEASREWLQATLQEYLRQGWDQTVRVIEAAEEGDEIAHAALMGVYRETLDRHEMPGATILAYGLRAREPVRRAAGRNTWFDNWRRDIGIAVLVYFTKESFKLRPTRKRESKKPKQNRKPSACSVVADALSRARIITITEGRVENIWAGLAGQVAAFVVAQKMSTPIPPN